MIETLVQVLLNPAVLLSSDHGQRALQLDPPRCFPDHLDTLLKYQMLLMNASDNHGINSGSSYNFCLVPLGKVLLICDGVLDQSRHVEFVNIQ